MLAWVGRCLGLMLFIYGGLYGGLRAMRGDGLSEYSIPVLPSADCPDAPCWDGISLNGLTHKIALNSLNARFGEPVPIRSVDETRITWFMALDFEHIHEVRLSGYPEGNLIQIIPSGLKLGEVVLALGEPSFVVLRYDIRSRQYTGLQLLDFYYPEAALIVTVRLDDKDRLSPLSQVTSLIYGDVNHQRPIYALAWEGFQRSYAFVSR